MKKKYLVLMMGLTLSLAAMGTASFAEEAVSEAEMAVTAENETAAEEIVEMISVEDTEKSEDTEKGEDLGESQDASEHQRVLLGEIKEVTEEGIVIAIGEEKPELSDKPGSGAAGLEETETREPESSAQSEAEKVLKITGDEEIIPVTRDTYIGRAAGERFILEEQGPVESNAEDDPEKEAGSETSEAAEGTEDAEAISESVTEKQEDSGIRQEEPDNETEEMEAAEQVAEGTFEAEEYLTLEDLKAGDLVKITLNEDGNAETVLILEQIQVNEEA